MEQKYLTARQVGERLGIAKTTIFKLVRRGIFPKGAKFGGARRWSAEIIDAWAKAQDKSREAAREEFCNALINGTARAN